MKNQYLDEILEQPDVIYKVSERYPSTDSFLSSLNARIVSGEINHIILTGMGASLASCYPLWLSLSMLGIPATMWETSELIYYGYNILSPKTLVIVVSQSGESVEIRQLADLRKSIGYLVAITNNVRSTIGKKADANIELHAGKEETVSTKTYTASLAALHLLGEQLFCGDLNKQKTKLHDLANILRENILLLREKVDEMASFFGKTEQLAIMGRGFSIASVQSSSLILKEASKIFTFGLSSGQFRHGPREIIKPGLKAILFTGCKSTQQINQKLVGELSDKSSLVAVISQFSWNPNNKNVFVLKIPAAQDNLLPILEIVPVQFLTIPLAEFLGYKAGVFLNSAKVTLSE